MGPDPEGAQQRCVGWRHADPCAGGVGAVRKTPQLRKSTHRPVSAPLSAESKWGSSAPQFLMETRLESHARTSIRQGRIPTPASRRDGLRPAAFSACQGHIHPTVVRLEKTLISSNAPQRWTERPGPTVSGAVTSRTRCPDPLNLRCRLSETHGGNGPSTCLPGPRTHTHNTEKSKWDST